MGSSSGAGVYLLVISMALVCSSIVMATNHIVGDDHGWTTNFNYTNWANSRVFRVGDTLEFDYDNEKHNVVKVNGTQFQQCTVPNESNQTLTSGKDVITLMAPGKKWYICGINNHCKDLGMKLTIFVEPNAPTPAPSPSPFGF